MQGAIRRPDHPDHYMVLKPIDKRVVIKLGSITLADSKQAIRLLEAGKTLYDPTIYIPREDIAVELAANDKTTYCPLKGDAAYFDLPGDDGVREIAWSYEKTLEFADEIKDLIAYYPSKVSIEEHPITAD